MSDEQFPLELTDEQETALYVFSKNYTRQEVCNVLGISYETYYRWNKNPVFKAKVKDIRERIVQGSIDILKQTAIEAIETILTIMREEDKDMQIKLKAANDIYNHLTKWKQLEDFDSRLTALENLKKCEEKKPG